MSKPPDRIPWNNLLHFGFTKLRCDPASFWKLSVREFLILSETEASVTHSLSVATRQKLADLINKFPD